MDLDLSYNGGLFASFLASTSGGGGGGGGGGGEEEGGAAAASPSPSAHLGGTLLGLNLTSCGLPHLGGGEWGVFPSSSSRPPDPLELDSPAV